MTLSSHISLITISPLIFVAQTVAVSVMGGFTILAWPTAWLCVDRLRREREYAVLAFVHIPKAEVASIARATKRYASTRLPAATERSKQRKRRRDRRLRRENRRYRDGTPGVGDRETTAQIVTPGGSPSGSTSTTDGGSHGSGPAGHDRPASAPRVSLAADEGHAVDVGRAATEGSSITLADEVGFSSGVRVQFLLCWCWCRNTTAFTSTGGTKINTAINTLSLPLIYSIRTMHRVRPTLVRQRRRGL